MIITFNTKKNIFVIFVQTHPRDVYKIYVDRYGKQKKNLIFENKNQGDKSEKIKILMENNKRKN